MMPAASIQKHKLNSDTVLTFFTIKANHECKSLTSLVFISKLLTAGDLTSGTKVQPLFALKSAGAKKEAIVL
jgi:hypothetical protein